MRRATTTTATAAAIALIVAGCQGGAADEGTEVTVPAAPAPTVTEEPGEPASPATEEPTGGTTEEPTDDGENTVAPAPAPTGTPAEPPTDEEDIDESALPDWSDPAEEVEQPPESGAWEAGQEIVGVRVGAQDGFDRVVLDLSGDDPLLGWFGLYQDEAYEAGSGAPIDVAGDAVLSVPVVGIDWLTDRPERSDGSDVQGGGTSNATEVVFGILNEGEQQVFVGVEQRTPYRIFSLPEPARIVIDIQHP